MHGSPCAPKGSLMKSFTAVGRTRPRRGRVTLLRPLVIAIGVSWILGLGSWARSSDDRSQIGSAVPAAEGKAVDVGASAPIRVAPSLADPAFALRVRSTRELWQDRQ